MAKINNVAVKSVSQSVFGQGRKKSAKVMSLPLDLAFRLAQQGAVVNVDVATSMYTESFTGMVRVERSVGRSGRPALAENTNWKLPTGSLTLVCRKLDGSGEVVELNWRRDHAAIKGFDVQSVPESKETVNTQTHKAWQHAAEAPSALLVTPESHQLPAMAGMDAATATLVDDSPELSLETGDSENYVAELAASLDGVITVTNA